MGKYVDLENIVSRHAGMLLSQKAIDEKELVEYKNISKEFVNIVSEYAKLKGQKTEYASEDLYLKAMALNNWNPNYFEVSPELSCAINDSIDTYLSKDIVLTKNVSSLFQFSRIMYTLMTDKNKVNKGFEEIREYSYDEISSITNDSFAGFIENYLISHTDIPLGAYGKLRHIALDYLSLAESLKNNEFSEEVVSKFNALNINHNILFNNIPSSAKASFFKLFGSLKLKANLPIIEKSIFTQAYYAFNEKSFNGLLSKAVNGDNLPLENKELYL